MVMSPCKKTPATHYSHELYKGQLKMCISLNFYVLDVFDKGRKKNGLNKINSLVSFESIHKEQSLSSPLAIGQPVDKIDDHYSKVSKEDY